MRGNLEWSSCKVIYDSRPPHIWRNIFAFPHLLESPSSYMNLQLLHSEFPYISGKFNFLFYQCIFSHLSYYCQFFSKLILSPLYKGGVCFEGAYATKN